VACRFLALTPPRGIEGVDGFTACPELHYRAFEVAFDFFRAGYIDLELFTLIVNSFATMADFDLQEIHDFMIAIARKAGETITSATPSTDAAGSKKNCEWRPSLH
jgi:hypothetical protein